MLISLLGCNFFQPLVNKNTNRIDCCSSITLSKVNIRYRVSPAIGADSCNCWASASEIVLNYWRNVKSTLSNRRYTVAEIKAQVTKGCPSCDLTCGLRPQDTKNAGSALGLSFVPPRCYGVNGFASLLRSKGPLVFIRPSAGSVRGAFAIVISGMRGDGSPDGTMLETIKLYPQGQGNTQRLSFTQLMQKMEQLGFWEQGDWSSSGCVNQVYIMYKNR
ncbi:MAG: hypothetical protein JWQ25_2114 [Daejeonella sp.]|nr:hypothetical protein [Daejeonella sp.]